MKTLCTLAARIVSASACAQDAQDAQGYWSGKIANALGVAVQFEKADSRWTGTLSVPEQNLKSAVEKLVVTPDQLSFSLAQFNATYAARWDPQSKAWTGTWTQGQAAPLILTRTTADALVKKPARRPQEDALTARAAS